MNILDRRFIYTPSHATDIRKTFERIRLEQAAQKPANVTYAALDGMPMIDASRDPVTGRRLWRAK